MIAFKDKTGTKHDVDNMAFEESKNGRIKCIFRGRDNMGFEIDMSEGKGFSLSEAFMSALDNIRTQPH